MYPAIHVLLRPSGPIALIDTARAIAASPIWQSMGHAALVLRSVTGPLSAIGHFDAADRARLEHLGGWLPGAVAAQRYIDYPEVTAAVVDLANQLHDRYGDEIRNFDFAAIPRGGLIVLGLLSYALGLEGDVGAREDDPERPLVVVDDCSLTGNRLKRFLDDHPARNRIIFAHICSHPDLRSSIVEKEKRVEACHAAIDLRDLAPERFGADYDAWKENADQRGGRDRYWLGQTDEVAFPWNEPDHNFWNPVTKNLEWGWTIVPPEKCIKNRRPKDNPPIPVIEFDPIPGEYVVNDAIVAAEFDGQVHVLNSDSGETFTLSGVAADIWDGIVSGRTLSEIADAVTNKYDIDTGRAREDARSLIDQLCNVGAVLPADSMIIDE